MKRTMILCAALALSPAIIAQSRTSEFVPVVEAQQPLTSKIVFLVDVSGSMIASRISEAIRVCLEIIHSPTDDLEIRVLAFRDEVHSWGGLGGNGGWTLLPDASALPAVSAWIDSLGGSGGTGILPAIRAAFEVPRKDLSVVLVTDGEFPAITAVKAFKKAQADRVKAGHGVAHLLVWGVGDTASDTESLRRLGKEGGGGFWVYRRQPPTE